MTPHHPFASFSIHCTVDCMRVRVFSSFLAIFLAGALALFFTESRLQDRYNPTKMAENRDNSLFFPSPVGDSSISWQREGHYINLSNFQRRGFDHFLDNETYGPDGSGRKRILLVGDSFVYGTGVANPDDMLGQRLEDELNRSVGRYAFDVQVLGLHGASTLEESEWLTDEVLDKLDPDLIVLGLVPNDGRPSGREVTLCGSDLFCDESLTSVDVPEYAYCLKGESGFLPRLVRFTLRPLFPLVSESILSRHCDPERFAAETGTSSQQALTAELKDEPFMKFFFSALDRFVEINEEIPVTVSPLYIGYQSFHNRDGVSELIRDTGLVVAEMPLSSDASRTSSDPFYFRANPVDEHPNRYLNEMYAKDIADALFRDHSWMLEAPAGKQRLLPLVSSFLPLGGKVGVSNDLVFTGVLTSDSVPTRGMLLNDGTRPADQVTPCAILGKAHGSIFLRSGLSEGQRVELSLQSATAKADIVDVYVSYVDQASKSRIRKVGELRNGDSIMFTLGKDERTILMAPRSGAECGDIDEKLVLPPLGIELFLR